MNEYLKTYLDYRSRVKFDRTEQFEFKYIPENLKEKIAKNLRISVELLDENPSEEIQLEDVSYNGFAIQYIKNPSEQVQLEAVRNNIFAIQSIENPSEQVQSNIVRKQGNMIRFIKNPSEEIQLIAIMQDIDAIEYINNPTPTAIEFDKILYNKP